MDHQGFLSLCRDVSLLLELPDPDRLGNEGYLEHEGIRLALFHDPDIIDDRLFCYVDIGPVNEASRPRIFERLLTLNLLSGSKTSGVYALDPGSGNVIFCVHIMQPDRLDAQQLADMLRAYVERALNLQHSVLQDVDDLSFMDTARQIFNLDDVASPSELA